MDGLPARVFDSHLHIIEPGFPLCGNAGFLPDPFTIEHYRARTADLPIIGGALVSGSFQGLDTTYLTQALQRLGPGFAGVAQVAGSISEGEILGLDRAGVRGIRCNYYRGAGVGIDALLRLGRRVHEVAGWHVELYLDAAELPGLRRALRELPAVSIDHLGLTARGLPALLRAVDRGARVKATGFSRGDLPIAQALQAIHAANPQALMFGTDLPCTRAPTPFSREDVLTLCEALDGASLDAIFCTNALHFYRLPLPPADHRPAAG